MKKQMHICTAVFFGLTVLCGVLAKIGDSALFYSMAITFGTFSYHFIMRLLVGRAVDCLSNSRFDHRKAWFRKKKFEDGLYKRLRVKSWKLSVPTYEPENFDMRKHSVEEIITATCRAEAVHEIIVALSFVPILFSLKFGSIWVFIITSLIAAAVDMVFVVLQRFNRPRLVRLIKRQWT